MSIADGCVAAMTGWLDPFDVCRGKADYLKVLIDNDPAPVTFHAGGDWIFGKIEPHEYDPNKIARLSLNRAIGRC